MSLDAGRERTALHDLVRGRDGDRPHRHVLSVLHSFERTGPPLLALRFLRWARLQRPGWRFSTVSLGGDDALREHFAELGPTAVVTPTHSSGSLRGRAAAFAHNRRARGEIERLGAFDVAHVHCAGSMRVLDVLPPSRVLCHLHELDVGLDLHLGPRAAVHLGTADRYVAVSDAVLDAFLARVDVESDRVERQWGFVDPDELPQSRERKVLGVGANETLVVGSGVRHWRKAPELFVRAASLLSRSRSDIRWRFVWVGGRDDAGMQSLVDRAGLADVVQLLDHRPDSLRWIAAADVFFLSAREDAFPLVCVEAAAMGTPIVTFDSGGTPELVAAAGCGVVVPFPSAGAVADAIAQLASDDARRRRLGRSGSDFAAANLTLAHAGPRLLRTLEATMGTPR
jgi:glycosyltransferase involved in cell wall biosynthesis